MHTPFVWLGEEVVHHTQFLALHVKQVSVVVVGTEARVTAITFSTKFPALS
jgi:hypothetical protein